MTEKDKRDKQRAGEPPQLFTVPARSGRFFRLADNWFFVTREGPTIGPFDDLEQAQAGVRDYLEFVKAASPELLESFARSPETLEKALAEKFDKDKPK